MAIIEFERPFIVGDLLQLCGLSIGTKKAENTIISSSTIDEIYENYGYVNLKQTLSLIKNTWGGDKDSFHHNIMKAVSTLLTAHAYLNEVIFIKEVGKVSVNNLLRLGKEKRAGFLGVAEAIMELYNSSYVLSEDEKIDKNRLCFTGCNDTTRTTFNSFWSHPTHDEEIIAMIADKMRNASTTENFMRLVAAFMNELDRINEEEQIIEQGRKAALNAVVAAIENK